MYEQIVTARVSRLVEKPDPTEEEQALIDQEMETQRLASLASGYRMFRDSALSRSDWTQVPDSPLTDEQKTSWADYRQLLRNITDVESWPELNYSDWPTAPDGTKAVPAPPEE